VNGAQPDPTAADEGILRAAKIGVDGPSLLEFFRKRTPTPTNRERIEALIQQLGDDSFQAREQAAAELVVRGIAALPLLRQALKESDIEIVRRAERCLRLIEKGEGRIPASTGLTNAAARLLAARKPAGAAEVLLDFIAAMDDVIAAAVRGAVTAVALPDDKPDPVLVRALTDSSPRRREAAAVALCQPGAAELRPALRKLLHDPEPGMRLQVGFALVNVKEKEAIPALIDLLALLPPEQAWPVEDLLFQLAQEKAPTAALGTDDASRRRCSQAWADWWRDHGKEVHLSRLDHSPRSLGYTLLFFHGATDRVLELDQDGEKRWQIDNLQYPVDAQVLYGGRVLIAEYQGHRVTERNLKGEILWEKAVPSPMGVQRFPNGNTFVAARKQLLEVDRDGREVFRYNRPTADIAAGQKLRNGQIALVTTTGTYLRLDAASKEVKSFPVAGQFRGFGGFEALPNNGVLVADWSSSRALEYDADGTVVWEAFTGTINSVARRSNGNTLVDHCGGESVCELDRAGKVVRGLPSRDGGSRIIRARCR
jgi:HEAT repeat protein